MKLLFFLWSLTLASQHLFSQSSISYFDDMLESISKIKTIEYELHAHELIDDKLFYTYSKVKLQQEPFCFYNYIIEPDNGVEILFTSENNYALINPNGFPFVNLKLDPYGVLIRRNQHHTLFDAGFESIKAIILSFIEVLRYSPDKYIIDLGVKEINNIECQVIKVINPYFSFLEYTVKDGEEIESIAKRLHLSSYLILLENNLSFYNDVEYGDIIRIPNSYGETFEIWIDLQSNLPIVQKIFLDDELFEHYEFQKIIINPEFSNDEFSKNFAEYDF